MITLDVIVECVILRVRKVLPFKVLLLEGQNGQTWRDHVCNCAPCHFPDVDGQMGPSLAMVLIGLRCMLCGQALGAATMLICDKHSRG